MLELLVQQDMQEVLQYMTKRYEIIQKTGELFEQNSFLCIDLEQNVGVLIDPATEAFTEVLETRSITLAAVILTHGHIDHIYKVDYYAEKYNVPVYIHQLEVQKLQRPEMNLSAQMMATPFVVATKPVALTGNKGTIPLDKMDVTYEVRAGDSEGNIMLRIADTNICFVGDSVFKDSIGRYDLPGSNTRAHHDALTLLLEQDPKDILYSGHGPKTTVANLATNMVLQQFLKYGM